MKLKKERKQASKTLSPLFGQELCCSDLIDHFQADILHIFLAKVEPSRAFFFSGRPTVERGAPVATQTVHELTHEYPTIERVVLLRNILVVIIPPSTHIQLDLFLSPGLIHYIISQISQDGWVLVSHTIKVLEPFSPQIYRRTCPVCIADINREDHHVFLQQIRLFGPALNAIVAILIILGHKEAGKTMGFEEPFLRGKRVRKFLELDGAIVDHDGIEGDDFVIDPLTGPEFSDVVCLAIGAREVRDLALLLQHLLHESQLVGLESLAPFASLGSLGLFTKGIVQEFFTSTQVFVGR